jgi:hypothetical protein
MCMLLILFKAIPRTKPYKLTVRSTLGFCLIISGGVKSSSLSAERNKTSIKYSHFSIAWLNMTVRNNKHNGQPQSRVNWIQKNTNTSKTASHWNKRENMTNKSHKYWTRAQWNNANLRTCGSSSYLKRCTASHKIVHLNMASWAKTCSAFKYL